MILLLYVDDHFLTSDDNIIVEIKKNFVVEFEMKELGMMHYFLALEVWKNIDDIFLSDGKNVVDILNRFRMMDCNTISTPMASNMNLLCDTASVIVDATVYMKTISLLMYFMNTRPF